MGWRSQGPGMAAGHRRAAIKWVVSGRSRESAAADAGRLLAGGAATVVGHVDQAGRVGHLQQCDVQFEQVRLVRCHFSDVGFQADHSYSKVQDAWPGGGLELRGWR